MLKTLKKTAIPSIIRQSLLYCMPYSRSFSLLPAPVPLYLLFVVLKL